MWHGRPKPLPTLADAAERLDIGRDCDLHFNVQYMDTDEIERELEKKFAAKDVASMESHEEAEPLVSVEDFVSRSG